MPNVNLLPIFQSRKWVKLYFVLSPLFVNVFPLALNCVTIIVYFARNMCRFILNVGIAAEPSDSIRERYPSP